MKARRIFCRSDLSLRTEATNSQQNEFKLKVVWPLLIKKLFMIRDCSPSFKYVMVIDGFPNVMMVVKQDKKIMKKDINIL